MAKMCSDTQCNQKVLIPFLTRIIGRQVLNILVTYLLDSEHMEVQLLKKLKINFLPII